MLDLMAMRIEKNIRNLKTTVLHRPDGVWYQLEVNRLVSGLMTEISQHPKHPEYLILWGHHTKEQALKAILGGVAFTATQVTGQNSPELPFNPRFIKI